MRNTNCVACSLHKNADNVCIWNESALPKLAANPDFLIVGQNPGFEEDLKDRPFVGPSGTLLRQCLSDLGVQATLTNAIKCYTKDNAEPSLESEKACMPYLIEEIQTYKPKVILALGNVALHALTGHSGVLNHRHEHQTLRATIRKALALPDDKLPVILSTIHPAFVARNLNYLPVLQEDIAAAVRLLKQKLGTLHIPEAVWTDDCGWLNDLGTSITLDIESTGLNYREPGFGLHLIGVQGQTGPVISIYNKTMMGVIAGSLDDFDQVIGFNILAYDEPALSWLYGTKRHRGLCDAMLLAYLMDETMPHHNLQSCAVRWLGAAPWKDEVTWDWARGPQTPEEWERCKQYNARDVQHTRDLWYKLWSKLDLGQQTLYARLLVPAAQALVNVYETGVPISRLNLAEARVEAQSDIERCKQVLMAWGTDAKIDKFNPNSSEHIRRLLFDYFKFKPTLYTPAGLHSTNSESLKLISLESQEAFNVCHEVLDYRAATKLDTAIYTPYEKWLENDDRVHPSYSLLLETGRTSARNPNIQQLPRKPIARRIVRARPGYKLVVGDLSQIELRWAAFLSRDPEMLATYQEGKNGGDLHNTTALRIANMMGQSTFTKEHRTSAKGVNFGCLYGAEPGTLQAYLYKTYGLKVTLQEAKFFRDEVFFGTYRGLIPWYEKTIVELTNNKAIRSAFGRVRRLPNIGSNDIELRAEAARQGINTIVQGPASDLCLMALFLLNDGWPRFTVAEIHDALIGEILEPMATNYAEDMRWAMEVGNVDYANTYFGVKIDVPIKAEVKICDEWGP